jgi:ABC-type multidrug transport system fused ATPase/permease subunit
MEKLYTFVIYMGMFGWPLQMMMEHVQVLQSAMAALERIFGFFDESGDDLTGPAAAEPPGLAPVQRCRGEIEFQDVWFAYREGEWILKGLSFRAAPGERVAIAGPTGAGKTTVLSLASALYRPQKGRILLDGRDLAELDPRYVRRQVATVIQDVFLFSDTVGENVRLWEGAISDEEVRLACKRAHAAGFAERFEEGYAHKLGQRGGDISAGQRQLLSFARALAYDPPVLILDEATSSVDAETEENIRQGLKELTSGRTSLIVAHRFSTLADADRLLVIRDGQLHEETTPQAFLEKRRRGEAGR